MDKDFTVIAGTGHRPPKLGGFSPEVDRRLLDLAFYVLGEGKPDQVIVGMALGWDMSLALAASMHKIPFIAAVPFEGQEKRWPAEAQRKYHNILKMAAYVQLISRKGYSPEAMQRRNEWMVDNCNILLALWDGSNGGTANCVRYAQRKDVLIVNLWQPWKNLWSKG